MTLTEEEQLILRNAQTDILKARTMADMSQIATAQQSMIIDSQEQQKSIVKEQLDLSMELDTIEHLIKGDVLKNTADGGRDWFPSDNPDINILTDYGVQFIMNTLMFYLNKNSLLTNLEDDRILVLMKNFSHDLNDTIFMESEKIFKYPSFDECKKELINRIKRKTELRKFAIELLGGTADEKEIEKYFLEELEEKVEKEIAIIREQKMKNKYKRYLLLQRKIRDIVFFTLSRAWMGQERRSLRQHWNISEIINPPNAIPKRTSKLNPLN